MKNFQESLEEIQKSIDAVKDEDIKKKVQEQFDKVPKDESLYVIDTYNSVLQTKLPASATTREIMEAYVKDKAKDVLNHYYYESGVLNADETFDGEKADFKFFTLKEFIEQDYVHHFYLRLQDESENNQCILSYKIYNTFGDVISSEKFTEFDVAATLFYEAKISQELEKKYVDVRDSGWASKCTTYQIDNSFLNYNGQCNFFEIEEIVTDHTATQHYEGKSFNKAKMVKTQGVCQRQDRFSFNSASGRGKCLPREEIREWSQELGLDSNLSEYNLREHNTTTIVDGKITEIDNKKELKSEGNTRSKIEIVKLDGLNFTKETKKEKIEEVEHTIEQGTLLKDEKLSLDLKGEKLVQQENAGVLQQA